MLTSCDANTATQATATGVERLTDGGTACCSFNASGARVAGCCTTGLFPGRPSVVSSPALRGLRNGTKKPSVRSCVAHGWFCARPSSVSGPHRIHLRCWRCGNTQSRKSLNRMKLRPEGSSITGMQMTSVLNRRRCRFVR